MSFCKQCDRSFSDPTALDQHLRNAYVHLNVRSKPTAPAASHQLIPLNWGENHSVKPVLHAAGPSLVAAEQSSLAEASPVSSGTQSSTPALQQPAVQAAAPPNRQYHPHWCPRCSMGFLSSTTFREHVDQSAQHHPCPQCPRGPARDFRWQHELIAHLERAHFFCADCSTSFPTKVVLGYHFEAQHSRCSQCHRIFKDTKDLHSHRKTHVVRQIKCFGCGAEHKSMSAIMLHLEAGNCSSGCNARLINHLLYQFAGHEKVIVDGLEWPFQCPACQMRLTRFSALMQHAESMACGAGIDTGTILGDFTVFLKERVGEIPRKVSQIDGKPTRREEERRMETHDVGVKRFERQEFGGELPEGQNGVQLEMQEGDGNVPLPSGDGGGWPEALGLVAPETVRATAPQERARAAEEQEIDDFLITL